VATGTYSVKTAKGTYTFQGPQGLMDEDVRDIILSKDPTAFAPPAAKTTGQPNDFLSYVKQGLVGSAQDISSFTGIHNPLENWLNEQQKSIAFSQEEQARQKRAAQIKQASEGKGLVAGGLGAIQSFLADPQALAGQTLGGALPYVPALAAAATAETGVPEAIAGLGGLALAGTGVAAGAGGMKRGMYDAVKQATLAQGAKPEEAEAAALKAAAYAGPNSMLIAGGGLLGILDAETGIGGQARKAVVSNVEKMLGKAAVEGAEEVATAGVKKEAEKTVGQAALHGIAKEAPSQAVRSGFQQFGVNEALNNAGVDTNPGQGVLGAAIEGGIGGGLFGGVAGAVQQLNLRRNARLADAAKTASASAESAKASAGALSEREKAVQTFTGAGLSPEEAEQRASALYGPADATAAASDEPDVGRTGTDLPGAGRKAAAGATAGEAATPEAGGLGALAAGAERSSGAAEERNAPLIDPTTRPKVSDVRAALTSWEGNDFGVTTPFVNTVHAVMAKAYDVGKPVTLEDAYTAATNPFARPKLNDTISAIKNITPEGVKPTEENLKAINDTITKTRGAVPIEDVFRSVVGKEPVVKPVEVAPPPAPPEVVAPASADAELAAKAAPAEAAAAKLTSEVQVANAQAQEAPPPAAQAPPPAAQAPAPAPPSPAAELPPPAPLPDVRTRLEEAQRQLDEARAVQEASRQADAARTEATATQPTPPENVQGAIPEAPQAAEPPAPGEPPATVEPTREPEVAPEPVAAEPTPAPEPVASEVPPAPEPTAEQKIAAQVRDVSERIDAAEAAREQMPTGTPKERAEFARAGEAVDKLKSEREELFNQFEREPVEPATKHAEAEPDTPPITETSDRISGALSDSDKATLAKAYGHKSFSDATLGKFIQDFTDIINGVKHKISAAVRRVVENIRATVMAATVVFNPAPFHEQVHAPAPQVQGIERMVDIRTAVPDAARSKMSEVAQAVYETMAYEAERNGAGFLIADKPNGAIHAFDKDGNYLASSPALYGAHAGDTLTEHQLHLTPDEERPEDKITPAGTYYANWTANSEYTGGGVLALTDAKTGTYMGGIAVHAVYTGTPSEHRLQRLTSSKVADKKVSFGCINTANEFFLREIAPHEADFENGLVFVVPDEVAKTGELFPAEQRAMAETEPGPLEPGRPLVPDDQTLAAREEEKQTLQPAARKGGRRRKKATPAEAAAETESIEKTADAQVKEEAKQYAEEQAVPKPVRLKKEVEKLTKAMDGDRNLIHKMYASWVASGGKLNIDDFKQICSFIDDSITAQSMAEYHKALEDLGPADNNGVPALVGLPERVYNTVINNTLSSGLVNLFGKAMPRLSEILKVLYLINGTRGSLAEKYQIETSKNIKAFTRKAADNNTLLNNVMVAARSTGMDPTVKGDLASHDPVIQKYEAAAKLTPKQKNELAARRKEIDVLQQSVDKLKTRNGGMEVLKEMMDNHSEVHGVLTDASRESLDIEKLVDASKGEEVLKLLSEEPAEEGAKTSKGGMDKRYSLMPTSEMPKTYFPNMRFGEYWLGVGDTPSGRNYFMFATAKERDAALNRMAKGLGLSTDNREMFTLGRHFKSLRNTLSNDSRGLQRAASMIDKLEWKGMTKSEAIKRREVLKDRITQIRIQGLPENSFLKRQLHFGDITGASDDVHRSYIASMDQAINAVISAKFRSHADSIFNGLKEYVRPSDKSPTRFGNQVQPRLETVINALERRFTMALNPTPQNVAVAFLNRFAGLMFMTSPASALANATALFIRVYPRLVFDHGPVEATKIMTARLNMFDSMGMHKIGPDGRLKLTAPDAALSSLVKRDPLLQKAVEYGNAHGAFGTALSAQLGLHSSPHSGLLGAADDITREVTTFLTAGLGFSEKATRQITFLSAFELQMAKERKAGGTSDEQFQRAADYAIKTVVETVGDPSSAEHPLWMSQGIGRAYALFKRFSLSQTRFMLGSLYHAAGAIREGNPKKFARITGELGMSLAMVGLFAGVVGMPGYGATMAMIDAMDDLLLTPEEKQERVKKYGLGATNADLRFRFGYLQNKFGGPTMTNTGVDGLKHSLAHAIINGPISEYSGWNIGKRVGVDGLWFRGLQGGKSLPEVAWNTVVANVAGLSMADNTLKGIDDLNNGMAERGLEKILPAGAKGFFTAGRYASQGALTRDDKMLMAPEKFTPMELLGVVGGLQPTKLSTVVDEHYMQADAMHKGIDDQKAALNAYKRAVLEMNMPSADPMAVDKAVEKIKRHNQQYPLDSLVISVDMMYNSLRSMAKDRQATVYGTTVTKKNVLDVLPLMQAAQPVEEDNYGSASPPEYADATD
jgi:hypothetical protein